MEETMTKTQNKKIAELVRQRRIEKLWPQGQLATVTGISLRTIQRIERDGVASYETRAAIADALDIDPKLLSPSSSQSQKPQPQKKIHLLHRLTSGKSLADVVLGSDQFQFEHDEDHDPRSIKAMKGILELLKGDVVRLYDADPVERLSVEAELSQELKGLEGYGYYLFGIKRVIPRIVGGQKTQIAMCTIFMSHLRSPKIIRDKKFEMTLPAVLSEVAH